LPRQETDGGDCFFDGPASRAAGFCANSKCLILRNLGTSVAQRFSKSHQEMGDMLAIVSCLNSAGPKIVLTAGKQRRLETVMPQVMVNFTSQEG
jgi:hypothetical protein